MPNDPATKPVDPMKKGREEGDIIGKAIADRARGRTSYLAAIGIVSMLLGGFFAVTAGDSVGWLRAKQPWILSQLSGFGMTDEKIMESMKWLSGICVSIGLIALQQIARKVVERNPIEAGVVQRSSPPTSVAVKPAPEKQEQTVDELTALVHEWVKYADGLKAENAALAKDLVDSNEEREKLFGQLVWRRLLHRCIWLMLVFALSYMIAVWVYRSYNKGMPLAGEAFGWTIVGTFFLVGWIGGIWLQVGRCRIVKTGHQMAVIALAAFLPCVAFMLMSLGKGTAFHTEVYSSSEPAIQAFLNTYALKPANGYALYQDKHFYEMLQVVAFFFFGCSAVAALGGGLGVYSTQLFQGKPNR